MPCTLDAFRGLLAASVIVSTGLAGDWPGFRGTNATGVGEGRGLPVEMAPDRNLVWKTALPPGHSSPVLVGDSIFVTGWEGEKLLVVSLNRKTGQIRWRREVVRPRAQELHKSNSPASPSVVADGRSVYAFFGDYGLVAYGWDGQDRWKLALGPFNNPFGMGTSPLMVDDRLILNLDSETGSFIVAVDKQSGKVLWRKERPEVGRGFSTPVLYTAPNGRKQALIAGSHQLTAYDVQTGDIAWFYNGLTWQLKPTPLLDGERLYVLGWAGGADLGNQEELPPFAEVLARWDRNKNRKLETEEIDDARIVKDLKEADLDKDGAMGERDWRMYQGKRRSINALTALKLGGTGDITQSGFRWRYTKSLPNVPSPLLFGGALWMIKDGGLLTTLNPETGEVLKQGRVEGAIDAYFASPVGADGKVYLISEACHLSVIRATGEWEVIKVNSLDDTCHATPALVDGRVYVRTKSALYAFANSERAGE